MTDELELKLREVESAIQFFRRRLITAQSLRSVLIDLYELLGNGEVKEKPLTSKKRGKEIKE